MKRPRATEIMAWAGAGPYRWLLAVVMAIPLLAGPVGAQQPPTQAGVELPAKAMRQIETLLEAKEQRTPAQRKVISQLLDAARQLPEPTVSDRQLAADPDAIAESEWVTVDIRADVTPAVLERIRALGVTVVNSVPRYQSIRARLPLTALEPLASLEAVQFIRPADQPIIQEVLERSAGARAAVVPDKVDTSEGDVAHQADVARQTYTVDGTGIGIGVISDGVETLADQQATGDVPARVLVLPGQEGGSFDLACGGRTSGTEGTAILEIVHDLAPGAELFFADGGGGRAQMAQNIEDLCAAGADIIVDDIGYLAAAAFQDDVIAKAITAAAANGCFYFSSAGNAGNLNDATAGVWEGDFVSGGTLNLNGLSSGAVVHDFGGGVTGNRIKANSTRPIVLQWADPVDGSANDYDLFLIDEDDNVLASSTSTQDGTQDPIEYIGGSCFDDRKDTRLVIVKNSGAADRYVRLNYGRGTLELATAGQTFGHSASQDAIGVAAVDVGDAGGAGGVFDGTESVETFSSDGPRRIFFESDGTPITPGNFSSTGGRVLQKPDLAAADGVSTSTPGFSTFKGTSAAAPHAAAIAALMLEAAGGPDNVMPDALRTAMTGAALDIEETGVDQDSGAGIVMAPGAVDAVDVAVADRNGAPTVVSTPAGRTLAPGDAAVTIDVASAFSDPDNDTLTYTALSSDPDRLEISLTGSMLTLTPRVPGRVVVAVRATDSSGLSVTAALSVTVAVGTRDYDVDDDGLIAVATLAQLDAIRYDLNGDGMVDVASDWRSYYADTAFAEGAIDMGCPSGCMGYELADDLDFDTNGNGVADAGDDYWNVGNGWVPIGGNNSTSVGTTLRLRNPFSAIFESNGHTVSNLFIDTDTIVLTGFFGYSVTSIRNLGLIDVDVKGTELTAGLAAFNSGEIRASYVTGRVSADDNVGGLVGFNQTTGGIRASYATSNVSGSDDVGGLVGDNRGEIAASYATGPVSGDSDVGGLVGNNKSTGEIRASYATGPASGNSDIGGLVGRDEGGTIASSYWDTRTSGHGSGSSGQGKTTSQLQSPTSYSGVYGSWNVDLDGDSMNDDPWDFGTSSQYPVLSVDFDGNDSATWQEFGRQLREGPALMATAGATQIVLAWMPVETSHWTPAPSVTYTLTRNDGATLETLGEGLGGLTFTDTDVTAGVTYTYQVAGVVQGGEAAQSALVEAKTTALPNMWLSPTASDPVVSARSAATYTVTFQGAWNTTVTSGGVPSGAHFTTLIGGVHNAGVAFLKEGGMASAGVEFMAELGGTSTLANEVRAAEPNALSVLQGSGGNIGPTSSSNINMVTLTTDHPRITVLSMVAPSPDWFVGVSGFSLLDAQADWLPSQTVNLYPWDAGTEEGTEFSLSNAATSPQDTITSLRGIGKFSNERIATLTFTRQSVNTAPSFTSDTSFEADENQTATGRVAARDPDSGDGVAYALTGGADASKFDIGETTGVLTFQVPPNHERAADAASTDPSNDAGNNEYIVTVTATGGTGDRAMTTEQTITVTVRNVEEAGTVSFSQGGTRITAALSDPDGGVNSATWQWARSSSRSTGWTNIGSATAASYTPSSGDEGTYLRATVSYSDVRGSGKQAHGISTNEIAPPDLRVATLVSGLSIPWDIAFTPDGTMLFTQRAGVLSSRLADGTVQTIDADFGDLYTAGSVGLMGIVVDPGFASNRRFYTCQGHTGPEIQVIAWTLNAAYTQATRVADPLVGGIPSTLHAEPHGGCRLRFGPEGYLWIATGDAHTVTVAQDLNSLGGKVLRVDASTGAGAPTNPFAPSRIYTYGHRNPQGLALRPGTSQMWSVEHGPSVDDEINLLVAGRNYGWDPGIVYDQNVPMTDLVEYPDAVEAKWSSGSPTLATSGAIFVEGNQWGVWEGRLAVATLRDSMLRLFEFTPDGAFVSQVIVSELDGTFGRLRTPMLGPDGALYVTTSNGGGVDRILRLAEDDPVPVTLTLTPSSIGENGGVSTVTASQDRVSIAATTVTVSTMAVNPAAPGNFMLSANRTLTIPAGQTDSTGTVTVRAVDNTVDAPNKTVTVSAAADNIEGVVGPAAVTLTVNDDDAAPAVTLWLTPGSIGENRGVSTVTASLERASSAVTTVTVSAMAVAAAVSDDFMLSANKTLMIAAGRTDSTGTVTVRAVDNSVDATNKEVRVSAAADNSQGLAGNPSPLTLRITDDDDAPELTLTVGPSSIVEDGGVSTVTVESVNGVAFAQDQQIALTFAGTAAKGTDYTVALERLTLTAGQSSVDTTVTAMDDAIDDDAETVLVTARHGGGVLGAGQTITIADDDDAPVIQTASPILVEENETAVATLAATDADRPAEDLRWRTTGGADRNRFRLTADGVLTFAVAQDYEAPGDSDGNGDYEVTAEVNDGANPVEAVLTVRLEDVDDTAPELSSASVNGATLTLTYGEALDGNSRPAAGDFTVSGGNSARTVSNVAMSGRAVMLTLNPAVSHGETGIRVSYRPGANPIRDAEGNDALRLSNEPVTNNTGDTTAPTVSRVEITSRPGPDATYAAGETIEVTVTFSETVVVTGTTLLRLNVGGIDRTANYRGGTGAALRFAYAVADGVSDTAGVSIEANRLTRNGGRIRDGANNNAVLTHDGLAADERHKVDGVKPALLAGGATVKGATLTLTYDEVLDGRSTPLAAAFTVNVEGAERRVSRVAVSGNTVTLTLDPPVAPNQTVRLTYRVPGANPIQDIAGNDARPLTNLGVENNTLDTTAPRVSRVAIASNPGPDGTYAEGDVMEVTVTFSETVQVDTTNGTPALALKVGRPTKPATYDRGSNSDRLVFSYMVANGDLDTDGVNIAAGRIALNGGTIEDLADNPAVLVYEAVPPQPGHAVDGVRPELQGATVSGDTLTLTYREALDEDSTPAGGDFTVDVAGAERPLTEVLVSGSTVALTLDSPVTPGQRVTVSYTARTRPIQDAAGNAAEDLTEYTAGTPPPPPPPPPPRPPTTGGGGGGGGGGLERPPSYPGTVRAEGGDGEVTLTWDAPSSQGSSRIQHYEYRLDGEGEWISTGSTDRIHTITGLIAGRVYFFHLRAVSAAGAGSHRISPEVTPVADLDFTHFTNGGFITSTLALVNAGAYPVRPAIYFYDRDGDPIAARSLVALTPDLEILDDGALSPRTVMNPLGELTIGTHGRGGQRAGSVTVRAASSIGGVLRFDIPGFGVAGVGDSPTVRDALVPVRRQEMGINTGVAVRNRGTATLTLQCRLMRDGAVLEEADIRLKANGQDARFIDAIFPAADTSDFTGSVRCTAPEPGRFSAVAFELDGVSRIFTTLPVVPVPAPPASEQEQEEEPEKDATRLDFTHFANGGKIVSSLVLVNAGTDPVRPAIYFHDRDGGPIAAESMVDITEDLEVGDDGALSPRSAIDPLGELTIATHGRGGQVSGSVAVTAEGPMGGVLRFDIPALGVAGVGDSPPLRDALVPVRRQDGGINTGVAVHNRGAAALLVRCRLMRDGAVLEETMIPLAANGQDARFIDQVFPTADTSDFAGSVRCMTPEPGRFSAVAFELDGVNRIFTTLPVVPVVDVE